MWCIERLANTEQHLDVSKGHYSRANDATDELKQLNKSIFRPVITFNKDRKRREAEQRVQDRYDDERLEREKAMMDVRDTQNRLGRAATYGRGGDEDDEELLGSGSRFGRQRSGEQIQQRKEQRKRYQFEAAASDDELEDEMDDNLDEIGEAAARLRTLGLAMGGELDAQKDRLDNMGGKTDGLDLKLAGLNRRVCLPIVCLSRVGSMLIIILEYSTRKSERGESVPLLEFLFGRQIYCATYLLHLKSSSNCVLVLAYLRPRPRIKKKHAVFVTYDILVCSISPFSSTAEDAYVRHMTGYYRSHVREIHLAAYSWLCRLCYVRGTPRQAFQSALLWDALAARSQPQLSHSVTPGSTSWLGLQQLHLE